MANLDDAIAALRRRRERLELETAPARLARSVRDLALACTWCVGDRVIDLVTGKDGVVVHTHFALVYLPPPER